MYITILYVILFEYFNHMRCIGILPSRQLVHDYKTTIKLQQTFGLF